MTRLFYLALYLACALSVTTSLASVRPLKDLPISHLKPSGWTREFLQRQESGLTGHPEESGFPFNTGMWTEQMNVRDREYAQNGSDWWPYEQTAYYLIGALRCGYLINSKPLLERAHKNIQAVIENPKEAGRLGPANVENDSWPMVVMMRMLFEEYANTQDPQLLEAIIGHYNTMYPADEPYSAPENLEGFDRRTFLHIEHLCSLSEITDDPFYAQRAQKLYETFIQQVGKNSPLAMPGMLTGTPPSGHAVTHLEFIKLPAILYMHTHDETYRTAVKQAFQTMDAYSVLADGLTSGVEEIHPATSELAHETCDAIEWIWSAGWALRATDDLYYADSMEKVLYNAAFSSVTKDFKAHQYYGAPNLMISMDGSNPWNNHNGWGYQVKGNLTYRPGHGTECCSGNIHRMLTDFLKRSWLQKGNELSAVLYTPGTVHFKLASGQSLQVKQETSYPFEHQVQLQLALEKPEALQLRLRIPVWSDQYEVTLNGKKVDSGSTNQTYAILDQTFKGGDTVRISFETSPRIQHRHKGVALQYGPLVYSLPIEAKKTLTTHDGVGKCSEAFPAYQLFPTSPWAYALSSELRPEDIKIIQRASDGYPWETGNAPIQLQVPARKVLNWKLQLHQETPPFPAEIKLSEKGKILTLEPMATTELRVTEFPQATF